MKCPFCAEEIQDSAIKCRFCGEVLNQEAFDQARAQLGVRSKAQTKDRRILFGALGLMAMGAAVVYGLYYGFQRLAGNDLRLTQAQLQLPGSDNSPCSWAASVSGWPGS